MEQPITVDQPSWVARTTDKKARALRPLTPLDQNPVGELQAVTTLRTSGVCRLEILARADLEAHVGHALADSEWATAQAALLGLATLLRRWERQKAETPDHRGEPCEQYLDRAA
jgi:hypothetical protein